MPIQFELPYPEDCGGFFQALAALPWAMWLDGGHWGGRQARFDVIVAFPRVTLVTRGQETCIADASGAEHRSSAHPFDLLAAQLRAHGAEAAAEPFVGGALGYFAYDLARRDVALSRRPSGGMPDMAVGLYDGMVLVDHDARTCTIRAPDTQAGRDWAERMRQALMAGSAQSLAPFQVLEDVRCNMDYAAYAQAFHAVQAFIREGDCYQVNLAMRFAAPCAGHPWHLYLALRQRNPAPYSAWLNFPFAQVLSTSPESFLSVRDGQVVTRPIKGTRPRGETPEADARLLADLLACEKDRAENLMIVDLLRNDLGRACQTGSIGVPELFRSESFATVHHLVSTVTGRLAEGKSPLQLLAAAFPGGSITGAPKIRAMQIIDALEPHRREVYCGAIGYLDTCGAMELNIAIRTLVCSDGEVRYWAGGGLVADSEAGAEYQECLDKGRALREVLQGFRGGPGQARAIP